MFDTNESLPSGYGYAGGTPSDLASLAPADGALPSSYGAATTPAAGASPSTSYAAPPAKTLADFAQGMSQAVQQTMAPVAQGFQASGKASAPTDPPAEPPKSSNWKVYAALGLTALGVGGTLWWLNRNKGE